VPSSHGGTPVPGDRVKVAFGMKRKAIEDAQGSPLPKKR
jgi:U4/U6.U5 tri-snRNP-associated protein 1